MANVIKIGEGAGGGSILIPKTITQNGTYNASSDNADGYSEVTVDVAGGGDSKQISYLKWQLTNTRSTPANNVVQLSEFYLYLNNVLYSWNSNVSITASLPPFSANESIEHIIDGSVDTKYVTTQWGSSSVGQCDIVINLGETITVDNNTSYAYVTGNDETSRDPISWTLFGSLDGSNWFALDARNNVNVPTARKTSTDRFSISVGSVEFKNYLKFNGYGIVLPWTMNSDYKIEVVFHETTYLQDSAIIGNTRNETRSNLTEYNNAYFTSTGTSGSGFGSWSAGEHTFITNNGNGKNEFDGVEVTDYTPTTDNTINYAIGWRATAGNAFKGWIKSYKIYSISSGDLLHELKPALIMNSPCLYDTIDGKIYSTSLVEAVDTIT